MTTLGVVEAAQVAGMTVSGIKHAIRAGRLSPERDDGNVRLALEEVEALGRLAAERRARITQRAEAARAAVSPRRTLSAAPLLRQIEVRGGAAACGIRKGGDQEALRRARLYGRLTPRAADRLAQRLGLTPWDLWEA